MNHHTAILIFTRTSEEEAKHKLSGDRLSYSTNQRICKELIARTQRVARQTRFPIIEINSDQQVGDTLSERLSNSIETVFQAGFEQVVVIGTDTPNISSNLLETAAAQINASTAALGASKDGGAYLIGFHKSSFNKAAFQALPWQENNVFQSLIQYFEKQDLAIYQSDALNDIDNFYDLIQFVKSNTIVDLINSIQHLLISSTASFIKKEAVQFINILFCNCNYNRPPPTIR